jgi:Tfp pilus assembly protein PilN
MRAVNLLPQELRSGRADGQRAGSAYVALGTLATLLVAVLVYVLTANQVASRQDQAADARRDADRAQARIAALGAFGEFERMAAARTGSLRQLTEQRFAWQGVMRDIARVLPEGSWLTELDAASSPAAAGTGAAPAASGAPSGPSAKLAGCAPRQPDVAQLMVRLGRVRQVRDVTLGESSRDAASSGGGSAESAGAGDCGRAYKFDVTAALEKAPRASGATAQGAPAAGGGGS